jgi:hypothetical protein
MRVPSAEPCRHYQTGLHKVRVWCCKDAEHDGKHVTIAGNSAGVWHYVMPVKR